MYVRIQTRLRVVWRTPDALQIGAPEPVVVLDGVSGGIEWLVARARAGTTRRAAIAAAVRHGATRAQAVAALAALAPVLVPVTASGDPVGPSPARVAVRATPDALGNARDVGPVVEALAAHGLDARAVAPTEAPDVGVPESATSAEGGVLLVEVADYTVPPRRLQPVVSAETPHLALVVGDLDVLVTPVVHPGSSPCLRCADLHRSDRDAAWPVVAAQLHAMRARASSGELVTAAAVAARAIAATASGGSAEARASAAHRVDLATGSAVEVPWRFHDGCGCRAPTRTERAPSGHLVRPLARS